MHSLSRRVKLLEDTNDQLETRLATALEQLRHATDVVDEQERLLHILLLLQLPTYLICNS